MCLVLQDLFFTPDHYDIESTIAVKVSLVYYWHPSIILHSLYLW